MPLFIPVHIPGPAASAPPDTLAVAPAVAAAQGALGRGVSAAADGAARHVHTLAAVPPLTPVLALVGPALVRTFYIELQLHTVMYKSSVDLYPFSMLCT